MTDAELLARLTSPDRAELRRACDEALARVGREPALRDALRERLRAPEPLARFAAAHVLFHAERPSLRLLPALLESLELPDGDLRWQAAQMLAALGRMQSEVLPVLLADARGAASPLRRRMSLYALRELAPERPETGDALLAALGDVDPAVRRAALSCFAKLSDPARALAERALALAGGADPDPRMARIAAVVLPDLVRFHPELREAAAARLGALERAADPSLARAAQLARARLGGAARALVLASSSPRRRTLLAEAGYAFTSAEPDVDETPRPGEKPEELAERLALAKARAVGARVASGACVLAADTVVAIDGDLLGKPRDAAEAVAMLLRLSGRTHRVLTGFALFLPGSGLMESGVVESAVRMHSVDRATAEAYAASGEPFDKAGGYAAQGEGGRFVAEIEGSRANVIGLPLEAVAPRLARLGVVPR